jgi:hypothetical protein
VSWGDIPGFVEVDNFLGRSLGSLAEVVLPEARPWSVHQWR